MKILLLSDSHSYIDDRILEYAKNADEIWHCGDFGNLDVEFIDWITPLTNESLEDYVKRISLKIISVFPSNCLLLTIDFNRAFNSDK